MPTRSSIRFVVTVGGLARRLLSVGEKKQGDLILNLHPANFVRDHNAFIESGPSVKLTEQRYSIHPSPTSQEGINVIKQTIVSREETIETYHHTRAIKSGNAFAPLYIRRFQNLSNDRYSIRNDKAARSIINIGVIDQTIFTLVLGVFVGPRNKVFKITEQEMDNFGVLQHAFSIFRIVILYSYIGVMPSYSTTDFRHFLTKPAGEIEDEKTRNEMLLFMNGLDEAQCISTFKIHREYLRNHFINTATEPNSTDRMRMMRGTRFFRHRSHLNPDFIAFIRSLPPIQSW